MNTSTARSRWMRSASARTVAAFGLAMAIGAVSTAPAFGEDRDHHPSQQNHGNPHPSAHQGHNGAWHGNQRYDHNHYRGNYYDDQRYGYVYAPPPVAYVPQPAPGISLFFPLQIR
ncbi:hypothetical protein AB4156_03370 [Cupriavidus sp. 2MCAB6]|uniref:hypothetical protein n=1 Tax=Cupriavidus sp. 2MCAB6 TaxID=3232981 RepID=UPI003F93D14E